jgi:hypothetical protein
MVCLDCYSKVKDAIFGGVMHHGRNLPERDATLIFEATEKMLAQEKEWVIARKAGRPGPKV